MTPEQLFVIGTALRWAGWFAVVRGAYLGFRLWFGRETGHEDSLKRGMIVAAGVAGALLLLSEFVPMDAGREMKGEGWAVPIVWMLMPFQMVVTVGSAVFLAVRLTQSVTAVTRDETKERLKAAAVWLGVGGMFYLWYRLTDGVVTVFRGVVFMSPTKIVALFLLAVAAVAVMVWSEKFARTRGIAKKFVTHIVLLSGCVVLGIPFLWLLITSFKEDRDITTTEGMVWVPRVQLTVPYNDPKKPLYVGEYRGRRVKGNIQGQLPDGRVLVEIERPFNSRGRRYATERSSLREIPRDAPVVSFEHEGQTLLGYVIEEIDKGDRVVMVQEPEQFAGQTITKPFNDTFPVREVGLRTQNYGEMLEWLPEQADYGMMYLKNTVVLVVMSVIGTVLSAAVVGYGFSRLRFPGRDHLFGLMIATMMLPGAVTMLPTFLIFRSIGWIDTLYPLWVPTFFAGAFNVFLLRQFFKTIPMELEDAAKIDGCTYFRTLFQVMMPQIKPVLAVISIWTFMGAWNNFMGPLIYVSTPQHMPIAYALQMFQGERGGEFALMMAFATLATIPTVLLFFFAQRYFIEGVQLSGLGGR